MKEYNGWSSYDTWNVMLWLQNNEELWSVFNRKIRAFIRAGLWRDDAIYCVKSAFAECFGEAITPDGISLNSREIDWTEIYSTIQEMYDLDVDDVAETFYEEHERRDSFGREIY